MKTCNSLGCFNDQTRPTPIVVPLKPDTPVKTPVETATDTRIVKYTRASVYICMIFMFSTLVIVPVILLSLETNLISPPPSVPPISPPRSPSPPIPCQSCNVYVWSISVGYYELGNRLCLLGNGNKCWTTFEEPYSLRQFECFYLNSSTSQYGIC